MKLNEYELYNINGGATKITATLLNSIARVLSSFIDMGRMVGSAIRRIKNGKMCP